VLSSWLKRVVQLLSHPNDRTTNCPSSCGSHNVTFQAPKLTPQCHTTEKPDRALGTPTSGQYYSVRWTGMVSSFNLLFSLGRRSTDATEGVTKNDKIKTRHTSSYSIFFFENKLSDKELPWNWKKIVRYSTNILRCCFTWIANSCEPACTTKSLYQHHARGLVAWLASQLFVTYGFIVQKDTSNDGWAIAPILDLFVWFVDYLIIFFHFTI